MKLPVCFLLLVLPMLLRAQDSIKYRMVFIGETADRIPGKLIDHVSANILAQRTTVFFLDENNNLPGSVNAERSNEKQAREWLSTHFVKMRESGASVYFTS